MPATQKNRRLDGRSGLNRQACKTLLNCYIRETGGPGGGTFSADPKSLAYEIRFPASGLVVTGMLSYLSAIGEHEYESMRIGDKDEPDSIALAAVIAQELRHSDPAVTDEREAEFARNVAGSLRNLSLYLDYRSGTSRVDGYLSSEQSLLLGHPFHPFPKNADGFTDADVAAYAPELGNRYLLSLLAVRKDVYEEEWLSAERKVSLPDRLRRELGNDYELLPVHPWQYERVMRLEPVQAYVREGKIVPLGNNGPLAYPTSSVRTVFVPEMNCNVKLSLDVQITNLRRNNEREQMRRTLDAGAYLRRSRCFGNEAHARISYEEGVCGCRFGDEDVASKLRVAYRPIEFDLDSTYVMATLAETPAVGEPCRLVSMFGRENMTPWFRRYVEISLLPLVRAAEEKGIHFEAHLQNTLLTVKDGMPHVFIVRDLEGVSVDRSKAPVGSEGPLFYDSQEAWARTGYYFIVNHLGSFIHAIARDADEDERKYWDIAREALTEEWGKTGNGFARFLLTADTFRAKRNLASCLAGRGEEPTYAPVANLWKIGE